MYGLLTVLWSTHMTFEIKLPDDGLGKLKYTVPVGVERKILENGQLFGTLHSTCASLRLALVAAATHAENPDAALRELSQELEALARKYAHRPQTREGVEITQS